MNNETTASQPKIIGDDAIIERAIRFIDTGSHTQIARDTMINELRKVLASRRAPAAQASATIQFLHNVCADVLLALRNCDRQPLADMLEAVLRGLPVSATIQAAPEEIARLRTVQSIGFKLTAALCKIPSVRKGDIDYVPREAVMDVVVDWRNKHDEAGKLAHLAATIQEPVMVAEPDIGALTEQSNAWNAVCKVLDAVAPGWHSRERTGMSSAVETISRLAAPMVAEPTVCSECDGEGTVCNGELDVAPCPKCQDAEDVAPMVADPAGVALQDLLTAEFECYRPTYPHGLLVWARNALLDTSPHRAATVKAVPSEALGEAPMECWSADQEDFIAQSIGELCDRNDELKPGDTVWVGKAVKPDPIELIDAEDIVTMMGERADDLVGEHADGYPDVDKEAEEELNTLLAVWIGRHARPTFWTITNVKPYILSANDFAAPLADKTGGGK